MDSINFQKNIRPYNNILAFASFGANFENLSRNGLQVIEFVGKYIIMLMLCIQIKMKLEDMDNCTFLIMKKPQLNEKTIKGILI